MLQQAILPWSCSSVKHTLGDSVPYVKSLSTKYLSHRPVNISNPSHHAYRNAILNIVVHSFSESIDTSQQTVGPRGVLPELVVSSLHRPESSLPPHVSGLLLHQEVPLDLEGGKYLFSSAS